MSGFTCLHCGKEVTLDALGTKNRNHCPFCLHSVHVDIVSGDRKSGCNGIMAPVGKFCKADGEEMLVHKCQKCNFIRWNRVAGDDDVELVEKLPVVEDPREP